LGAFDRKKEIDAVHVSPTAEAFDWSDPSIALGPHLCVGDLLHFDRRRAMAAHRFSKSLHHLALSYNALVEAWGGPIRITSGFCPEPFSRALGRPEGCLHALGMALDLVPLDGSISHFHRWLKKRWSGGLILHSSSVHIDTRNNGRFAKTANTRPSVTW
jgi:hypothetical protein